MLSDERLKALVYGSLPVNEEEELWLKEYKNVDFERFGLLLDEKDKPRDFKEKMWIENYLKNSKASIKKASDMDKDFQERKNKANIEYYTLIKSTFHSDYFCKKPISKKEYQAVFDKCESKAASKYIIIKNNPILSKIYNILPENVGSDEINSQILVPEFTEQYLCKYFKIDLKKLEKTYKSYITPEFIGKLEKIESKYKISFPSKFDLYDWLTDYCSYK